MPGYTLATIQYSDDDGFEFLISKPYRSGAYVSGAQKLAQHFVAELMTRRGSVRFDPEFGCRLPEELRGCNMLTLGDLHGMLARGINDVVTNFRSRERITDTPEEMLAQASIVDLAQHLDRVVVSLRLLTEAGENLVVRLPVEFMDT